MKMFGTLWLGIIFLGIDMIFLIRWCSRHKFEYLYEAAPLSGKMDLDTALVYVLSVIAAFFVYLS